MSQHFNQLEPAEIAAYSSLAIPGKPLIYIGDPVGKAFACVYSAQMYSDGIPGDSVFFKRVGPADRKELMELHARLGTRVPLAQKEWFEVVTD